MVSQRRRASGFTLIEVLVTIVIAGILMGIAVPNIQSLLNTQKMKSATFDLVTTAMLARSEAIKWGGANSASIRIVAPSNNFSKGWCILFSGDPLISCPDMTAVPTPAVPDGVMQVIKPTAGITYAYQGAAAPIIFTRTGRLSGGAAVTLLVTDNDSFATSRCVTFDTNGNARVRVMAAGTTSC